LVKIKKTTDHYFVSKICGEKHVFIVLSVAERAIFDIFLGITGNIIC